VTSTPNLYFAIPGDLSTLTGGYGYNRRLLAGLRELGLTVEILQLSAGFPSPSVAELAATAALFRSLPDQAVVLVDGLAFGVLEQLAAEQRQRLRLIALCHHPLALETGLSISEQQRLHTSEQCALAAAHAVLVTSAMTKQILVEQFAVPATKITVALPGTERRGFAACDGSPPLLLTVASLTRRKGHDVLIAALSQLQDLAWQARFVGGANFDPAWAAGLQQQVQRLGLTERIHFVGAKTDLHEEYSQADLFVLPSRFEGYGMVFAEALTYGLPIVAARGGAVPSVVPDSAGMLVAVDDVAALRGALRHLLTHPAQRQTLQHGAQAAAHQLTTWQHTANIVANLITDVSTR
jgi:glycosyltransferase involved in cell wall biosynthesis